VTAIKVGEKLRWVHFRVFQQNRQISDSVSQIKPRLPHLKTGTASCVLSDSSQRYARRTKYSERRTSYKIIAASTYARPGLGVEVGFARRLSGETRSVR